MMEMVPEAITELLQVSALHSWSLGQIQVVLQF